MHLLAELPHGVRALFVAPPVQNLREEGGARGRIRVSGNQPPKARRGAVVISPLELDARHPKQRLGVVRLRRQGGRIFLSRLVRLAALEQRLRQGEPGRKISRLGQKRCLELRLRPFEVALILGNRSQAIVVARR